MLCIFDDTHLAALHVHPHYSHVHGTARHGTARHGTARHIIPLILLLACTLLPAPPASASCTRHPALSTDENNAVPIPFGRVNLQHDGIQSSGSLLASVLVPSSYHPRLSPESVLWTCDLQDEGQDLHFLVATNGDQGDVGGDGLTDVSATWFSSLGLRQSMDGKVLSRKWRRVELRSFLRDQKTKKLKIRLRDIPPLAAELYKVGKPPANLGSSKLCGVTGYPGDGQNATVYLCHVPNSYLQLVGPGLLHDSEGADSESPGNRRAIQNNNGVGYRMYKVMRLSQTPSCGVLSAPSNVRFPAVRVHDIEAVSPGTPVSVVAFSVVLRCHGSAASGTGSGQTAMALQASPGAFAAAQQMPGMLTQDGGVKWLLSDQYGRESIAGGVGISLYSRASGGRRRYFASPLNDAKGGTAMGASSGWYKFSEDGQRLENSPPNYRDWELKLEARLERLEGQPVKPGKLHATARITVKVP